MTDLAHKWESIQSAPRDGTRLRLAHTHDPNSKRLDSICPIFGRFVDGEWELSAFFTCVDGLVRFQPNLYLTLWDHK